MTMVFDRLIYRHTETDMTFSREDTNEGMTFFSDAAQGCNVATLLMWRGKNVISIPMNMRAVAELRDVCDRMLTTDKAEAGT